MRKYIDIVNEGFSGAPPASGGFGRKGVTPGPMQPQKQDLRAAVEQARQFASADDYAEHMMDNSGFSRMNTDPQHIHDRWDREYNGFVQRWQNWQAAGYL